MTEVDPARASADLPGKFTVGGWFWAIGFVLILGPSVLAAIGAFDQATEVSVPNVKGASGPSNHPFVMVMAAVGGLSYAAGCVAIFERSVTLRRPGLGVAVFFAVATGTMLLFVAMRFFSPFWGTGLAMAALTAGLTMYFPAWYALLSIRQNSGLGYLARALIAGVPSLVGFVLAFAVFIGWG